MKRALVAAAFAILAFTFGYMSGCNEDDCNPAVNCVPLEALDASPDAADAAHHAHHSDGGLPHG